MSKLISEVWRETSVHEVVRAHLFAEGEKKLRREDFFRHVAASNFEPEECWRRYRLLMADARRRFLWGEIPPDTRWYVVDSLRDRHLKELDVIAHCNIGGDGSRKLTEVAKRVNWKLKTPEPLCWATPILFGSSRCGRFTVMEGNHRLVAYRCENPRGRHGRLEISGE